jgi:hypothetical protein
MMVATPWPDSRSTRLACADPCHAFTDAPPIKFPTVETHGGQYYSSCRQELTVDRPTTDNGRMECRLFQNCRPMLNTAVCTDYRNDDGTLCRFQLAEGNGHCYQWDTEIAEVVQELKGVKLKRLRPNY